LDAPYFNGVPFGLRHQNDDHMRKITHIFMWFSEAHPRVAYLHDALFINERSPTMGASMLLGPNAQPHTSTGINMVPLEVVLG
jgi:hypothetical protein